MENLLIILLGSLLLSFIIGVSIGRYPVQTTVILIVLIIVSYAGFMNNMYLQQPPRELRYHLNWVPILFSVGLLVGLFIGHKKRREQQS